MITVSEKASGDDLKPYCLFHLTQRLKKLREAHVNPTSHHQI